MDNVIHNNGMYQCQMDVIKNILSELLDLKLKPIQEKLQEIESSMVLHALLNNGNAEYLCEQETELEGHKPENFKQGSEKMEQQGKDAKATLPSAVSKESDSINAKTSESGSGNRLIPLDDSSPVETTGDRDTVKFEVILPVKAQVLMRDRSHGQHPNSQALEGKRSTSILLAPTYNQLAANFNYQALDQHIRPDVNNFKSVTTEVKAIVEQIGKGMNMELVFAGSSFEGLNIGYPFEFDIQLAVKEKFSFHKVQNVIEVVDSLKRKLTPVMLQEHLFEMLSKVLANTELPQGWSWFKNSTTEALHTHLKGFTVALEFKKGNTIESTGILLDLIPCIKLPWEFVQQNFEMSMPTDEIGESMKNSFYAVYQRKSTWRISTSVIENSILKEVDDSMKLGLRVAKYFVHTFLVEETPRFGSLNYGRLYGLTSLVASYFLKNTFLKTYLDLEKKNDKSMLSCSCEQIVQTLLENIEHSYSGCEGKISRHFLLNDHAVNLMENQTNRKKICNIVQEIKQHLESGCTRPASVYPLINYPEITLHSLK